MTGIPANGGGQTGLFGTERAGHAKTRGRNVKLKIRQKALFGNMPEVAWVKDGEGRFVAASPMFAAACGVPQRRLIGRTDWEIWPGELAGRLSAQEKKIMASARPARVSFPLAGPDGSARWTEIVRTPILGGDGRVIGTLGIARDVSPYKQAASRLRQVSRQGMRAREEEKRKLSNFLHDEIGSLIMRMDAAIFFAGEEADGGRPGAVRAKLDEAKGALGELASAVRRIASDVRPPALGVAGLAGAVTELARKLGACTGASIDCYTRISDEARIDEVVAGLVYRMIQEAVGNAIKHAAPKNIRIRVVSSGGRVIFSVSDDGNGFDPEAAAARGRGGLGLRIMREEAESMCGELSVRSARGFGTGVRGVFPFNPGDGGGENAD